MKKSQKKQPSTGLGALDLHLFGEGRHEEIYREFGARVIEQENVRGVRFVVWAPNARSVRVVGDFNGWNGDANPMQRLGDIGVWQTFVPGLESGALYKFQIENSDGHHSLKADPFAAAAELSPGTASRVFEPQYKFNDAAWMQTRAASDPWREPMSIYEVHLGSWRHLGEPLSYRNLAPALADYVTGMGFTHVELMPVMEHPFGGSWGYQVTGYYAPTARYGSPDDFRYFVDYLHNRGIGVIVDWVPAHFPKDAFALGRFDGTALFEHLDARQGEHPDWGTFVFNFGRTEVRNFLLGSALCWLDEFHIDGLRVDAVASMLYLDYSRQDGQWVANKFGGRENLEAIDFIRELNAVAHRRHPGVLMIAEESTAWPAVSRPTDTGGLGFGFKWNMGWMHDTLAYFSRDPVYRRYHHDQLSFSLVYAWNENFILPFSHDEVVHGKGSMLDKMPGDRWQKHANLRSLYAFMWAHPGKKLLFMGSEFGQWREWSEERQLDWELLGHADHAGMQRLVGDLNRRYLGEPALWEADHEPAGFEWIEAHANNDNVLAFMRMAPSTGNKVLCVCNLSSVPRNGYRLGAPVQGRYEEILNTDAAIYGGSNLGNGGGLEAEAVPHHGRPFSLNLTLPPLCTLWFAVPG